MSLRHPLVLRARPVASGRPGRLAGRVAPVLTVVGLVAAGLVVAGPVSATPTPTPGFVETTVDNPVTAAPPISRPPTAHCRVTLATHFLSNAADGSPQDYSGTLTPPAACPGAWSKVVLDQTISVSGRQFDRSAGITVGGVQIYFGTTAEPAGAVPTVYRVETDVTAYSALFHRSQPFSGGIGNYTSDVYTGVFDQTVSLTFYRADKAHPAPDPADVVTGAPSQDVSPSSPTATTVLTSLPRNIVRAQVQITLKGNGCDEQWFDAVPDALVSAHPAAGLCGHGPFREANVALDGTPVANVHTFPYIYTGGIVPTLWRPVPAIGTFSFTPETVDVTPFVGRLVDGRTHTLTATVNGIADTWQIVPTLLLWTDHGAARTTGALTTDQVAPAAPTSTVTGDTGDSATTTSARTDVTSGWVQGSAGRVSTTVVRSNAYRNATTLTDDGLTQHVDQTDRGTQVVTTSGATHGLTVHAYSYPITVDYSAAAYVDDQNFSLTGHVVMTRQLLDSGPAPRASSETVDASGVLTRTNGLTTASDGSSTTTFVGTTDDGRPYAKRITTEHGLVTSNR